MVKPKKHLGQHFLTEENIARRIADAVNVINQQNVLEIGPGKGILSKYFLEKKNLRFKVVDIDRESIDFLHQTFPDLDVIEADFLKIDLEEMFDGEEFAIVGNFPYNISSQILFKTLDNRILVPEFTGMFQREVARRIGATPGNKEYGILSVISQACYDVEYLFTVNEGVFYPPPKVKSGVIRMRRKEDFLSDESYSQLKKVVKMAFNQRRKQMRNSLKSVLPENFTHDFLSKRPEELHYTDFMLLIKSIEIQK